MRVIIQRVSKASVLVDDKVEGNIGRGLLVLVGISETDTQDDIKWLCNKIVNQRIFSDKEGKMNLSLIDVNGEILVVSQFTLYANTKKGNRPSYIRSAKPDKAIPMYELFITLLTQLLSKPVQKGVFGADMKVELLNDGPVTIMMDSKNKEL